MLTVDKVTNTHTGTTEGKQSCIQKVGCVLRFHKYCIQDVQRVEGLQIKPDISLSGTNGSTSHLTQIHYKT